MKVRKPINSPIQNRITCNINDAIDGTGLSRRQIERLIQRGTIKSKKVGRTRLLDVPSLLGLVTAT